ncbi:MAG TPA: dihydrodipicolinate synthase family protein, partial [bacterium]|nr:dihydrodipicolinate synthase family protein [bacterium]
DIAQVSEIIRLCGKKINVISGDDGLFFPILALGGRGVISVLANIMPSAMVKLYEAFENRDFETARNLQLELLPIIKAMFIETNPIPVKTAAALMGLCEFEIRLPLCNLKKENYNSLVKVLEQYNLIKK